MRTPIGASLLATAITAADPATLLRLVLRANQPGPKIDGHLTQHSAIMNKYDPERLSGDPAPA